MLIRSGIPYPLWRRPFKFINSWVLDPDFEEIVQSIWNTIIEGSLLYQVCQKLKLLKSKLKAIHSSSYSSIPSWISSARSDLFHIQQELAFNPEIGRAHV